MSFSDMQLSLRPTAACINAARGGQTSRYRSRKASWRLPSKMDASRDASRRERRQRKVKTCVCFEQVGWSSQFLAIAKAAIDYRRICRSTVQHGEGGLLSRHRARRRAVPAGIRKDATGRSVSVTFMVMPRVRCAAALQGQRSQGQSPAYTGTKSKIFAPHTNTRLPASPSGEIQELGAIGKMRRRSVIAHYRLSIIRPCCRQRSVFCSTTSFTHRT